MKKTNQQNQPSLGLLITLGSIAMHVDEVFDNTERGQKLEGAYLGAQADMIAIRTLLDNSELREWMREMGVLLPLKRNVR